MENNQQLIEWLEKQNISLISTADIVNNEVSAVISSNIKILDSLDAYKKTADYVYKLSEKNEFDFCCIKAIRTYSHFNTDLNIAVNKYDFKKIIKLLEDDGWSRRSRWSQFKENIAERGKRKLVCDSSRGLSEIHLYPGLSWHGFEYASPEQVLENKNLIKFQGKDTYNTNKSLDLISNIGHALFERYKFTAGEIFHVGSIIDSSTELEIENAIQITEKNGWNKSFKKTIDLIKKLKESNNISYPILIKKNLLWLAWKERILFQLKSLKPISALVELLFNLIWSGPIYTLYSKIKKIFLGKSGIEKKYGDLL